MKLIKTFAVKYLWILILAIIFMFVFLAKFSHEMKMEDNLGKEEVVSFKMNQKKLISVPRSSTVCFAGHLGDDVLSFVVNCGDRSSYSVFMRKDFFPYEFYIYDTPVKVDLLESDRYSVKLRFYHEKNES